MVVISHRLPSILPALAVGCGRVVRAMARLIARSMDQMAIDRRLSILNDHLLRDIGVDARMVRERARAAELGSPSRSPVGPEIAPGVPAGLGPRCKPLPGSSATKNETARPRIRLVRDRAFRA
jgi:hypothetical protein